jgi:hypothetical protein
MHPHSPQALHKPTAIRLRKQPLASGTCMCLSGVAYCPAFQQNWLGKRRWFRSAAELLPSALKKAQTGFLH